MFRAAIVVVVTTSLTAARADRFRLFFDTSGNAGSDAAPHPGEQTLSFENPTLGDGGGRLYIYAEFQRSDQVIGSPNYDIEVDGGTISEAWNYNGPGQDGLTNDRRWDDAEPNPVMNPGGNHVSFTAVNLTHMGLKNGAFAESFDVQYDNGVSDWGTTLLGYVDVVNDGGLASVWMSTGDGNRPEDEILFGFGDLPVPASPPGTRSELPEATIVPEPASLMLLLVGLGVVSRRRGRCEV